MQLRKPSIVLGSAALIASALNFFIYVLLPRVGFSGEADIFLKNYVIGGFFLFSVGSSVAQMALAIEASADPNEERIRYIKICLSIFLFFLGLSALSGFGSFIDCIACGSLAIIGYIQSRFILCRNWRSAFIIQVLVPLQFAILFSLGVGWDIEFCISSLTALIYGWLKVERFDIDGRSDSPASKSMIVTMICGMVIPLYMQFELLLFTRYFESPSMFYSLQKLYASVAISLTGSIGIMIAAQRPGRTTSFVYDYLVAGVVVCLILVVAVTLNFFLYDSFEYRDLVWVVLVGAIFTLLSLRVPTVIRMYSESYLTISVVWFLVWLVMINLYFDFYLKTPIFFSGLFFLVLYISLRIMLHYNKTVSE